jgi:hypothetical protein
MYETTSTITSEGGGSRDHRTDFPISKSLCGGTTRVAMSSWPPLAINAGTKMQSTARLASLKWAIESILLSVYSSNMRMFTSRVHGRRELGVA